jgi:Xaa-Pro aminopeptidase
MLSREGCLSRRQRLWGALPREIRWVLVADPRHVNYLSGFWVNPLSHSAGERGLLFLERGGEAVLLADNFALSCAGSTPHVDRTIAEAWYDQRHGVPNRDHSLFAALGRLGDRFTPDGGLVETEWLPVGALEAMGWEPKRGVRSARAGAGGGGPARSEGARAGAEGRGAEGAAGETSLGSLLRELRRSKDSDELATLKDSIRAGEAGQRRGREVVRPGAGELEVYREVQSAALAELGMPAVVYGDFRANSPSLPNAGGPPTEYRLREADLLILDFSVVVGGYRGDFTSTIAVGEPTGGQRELLDLCRAALAAGEALLKPGAAAREVYRAVAAPFAAAGRAGIFPHHAGHGLGLGHPEAPAFVPESEETLSAGEVVTLEPGAYAEGVGGIRIEHNYLITGGGFERLTHHSLEL